MANEGDEEAFGREVVGIIAKFALNMTLLCSASLALAVIDLNSPF